jgi:hypothetical protein
VPAALPILSTSLRSAFSLMYNLWILGHIGCTTPFDGPPRVRTGLVSRGRLLQHGRERHKRAKLIEFQ